MEVPFDSDVTKEIFMRFFLISATLLTVFGAAGKFCVYGQQSQTLAAPELETLKDK
jgi:hypothetical protein